MQQEKSRTTNPAAEPSASADDFLPGFQQFLKGLTARQFERLVNDTGSAVDEVPESNLLADYLTEHQLAAELGVGLRSLRRWRALRRSPPYVVIARQVYFRRDAVAEWLRNREQGFDQPKSRTRRAAR
jgi:hypothetical protein